MEVLQDAESKKLIWKEGDAAMTVLPSFHKEKI